MTCFLNKNIEKLALHLSSWTRPVSPKLHGTFNFLINFQRRCWEENGVFCVLTNFYLLFQGSENYLEKNTKKKSCCSVLLLKKAGNRNPNFCHTNAILAAKTQHYSGTTKKNLFCSSHSFAKYIFCSHQFCYLFDSVPCFKSNSNWF